MTDHLVMSPEQRQAIEHVMAELTTRFPQLSPQQIVAGPLSEFAFGALPPYSNLKTHKVTNVSSTSVGSFVICHGVAPLTHETLVLVIKRGEQGPHKEPRFGVTGGFTNLDFTEAPPVALPYSPGEQPDQGAVRELREELLDDHGRAILDIDRHRLSVIKTGIDYSWVPKGELPTQYSGFEVALTANELARVQQHIDKLHKDPAYLRACYIQTHGEVRNAYLLPLQDIFKMKEEEFTHAQEFAALKQLAYQLAPQPCVPIPLFLTQKRPFEPWSHKPGF